MDRLPLVISSFCFLFGFAASVSALKSGRFRPHRFNLAMMVVGFVMQTVFLFERGRALGHCPLTNLFEVLVFLCWSISLFYLLIGPAYRISLLGAFTEPLLFFIQAAALLAPIDTPSRILLYRSPWVEWHAALSVMAFGAFALAGVAGVMYLAQERQLKTHRLGLIFFQMPPITELATTNRRLLWVGLMLLTSGLTAAAAIRMAVAPQIVTWGGAVWFAYLLLLLARRLGPRRVAFCSICGFLIAVTALCTFLNHFHPGGGL